MAAAALLLNCVSFAASAVVVIAIATGSLVGGYSEPGPVYVFPADLEPPDAPRPFELSPESD